MSTDWERFWLKVEMGTAPSGCWLWTGSTANGYGQARVGGKTVRAHRASYELLVGPIPEGLTLDHLCHVKNCVRPEHLEPVTAAENTRRAHRDGLVRPRALPPFDEEVAMNVRAEAARRQITRADIAAALGMSQPSVTKRLSGQCGFFPEQIQQIADLLQIPVSRLRRPARCRSTALVNMGAFAQCALDEDHDGPHHAYIEWAAPADLLTTTADASPGAASGAGAASG